MKTIITAALCAAVLHLSGQNNLTEFEISYPKKSSRFPEEAIALWYSHTEGMYATDTIFIRCYEPKRINDELTTIQFERMEKLRSRLREEGCALPEIVTSIEGTEKNHDAESCFISYRGIQPNRMNVSEIPDDPESILVDDRGWRVKCLRSQRRSAKDIQIEQHTGFEEIKKLNLFKESTGMEYLEMINVTSLTLPQILVNEEITVMIPTTYKRAEQLVFYEIRETESGRVLCEETKAKLKKYDDTYFWVIPVDHSATLCLGRKLITDQKITFQAPEGMIIADAKMVIAGTNSFIQGTIASDQMTVTFPKSPFWKNSQVTFLYQDLHGASMPVAEQSVGDLLGKFNFNPSDIIPLSMNK